MIASIIISAAITGTGIAEAQVSAMPTRLEWIREVRSLLPAVQPADRPAAYRNYADMLVDVGECDAALEVLKDGGFEGELVLTAMAHASWLGERHCAAELGKLAISRMEASTSIDPLRLAEVRISVGAAIRIDGDDRLGAAMIADGEKTLETATSNLPTGRASANVERLWRARQDVLGTYAGTPFFAPAMTQYSEELAANLAIAKSYLPVRDINGFAVRFAAGGRVDLAELVASKLWPSDKRSVMSAAAVARNPEIGDIYGNKPAPHCVNADDTTGSKPLVSDRHGPFESIIDLSIRSGRAALVARCRSTI